MTGTGHATAHAGDERDVHAANFALLARRTEAGAWPRLVELRRQAMDRFLQLGYPTTRSEDWRHASVAPLAKVPFQLASAAEHAPGARAVALDRHLVHGLPGRRLTFFNGRFDPELSDLGHDDPGVRVRSLAQALRDDRPLLEAHLARLADRQDSAFVALNTAFLDDGGLVHVERGRAATEPVHLLFVTTSGEEPLVSHPRVLIVAEEASRVTVVETHAGSGRYLVNAVAEVVAGPAAVVEHVRLQRESPEAARIATVAVRLHRAASYTSHFFSLGGDLVRDDVRVALEGDGADCTLNGLYLGDAQQRVDVHALVDHVRQHGTSRQLYKGILAGRSRGAFNGRVVVRKDAQKTDASQDNHSLILSRDALADTKPQLEIHADDVKCSHGATIGQLDRDALFYCRARGLGEGEARRLLVHAFAAEVVERLRMDPVRDEIDALLRAWLPEGGP